MSDAADILSAAASNVFPGARVQRIGGYVNVTVSTPEGEVTDFARAPVNPSVINGNTDAVASAVMQIARNRFYNTPVVVEEPQA